MTDYFALLGQPRRPWLNPEELKAKYFALSAQENGDRSHSASQEQQKTATSRQAGLNAAYQHLREPKDRLLHLLELELERKPQEIHNVPQETMARFIEIGQLCRGADAFLAERERVSSPMLKAGMFAEALDWTDRLQKGQQTLVATRTTLEDRLKEIDAAWDSPPGPQPAALPAWPWAELEQLYRQFSFLDRWIGQLQERIVRLSL